MSNQKRENAPPDSAQIIRGTGGSTMTVRHDLAEEISIGHEIAPTAAAAAAKAEIEARIVHARKFPRDVEVFRQGILKDCKRPGFAEIALYRKPVGRKKNPDGHWENAFAVDFSVRFIESAIQHYEHVHCVSRIEWDTPTQTKLVVGVVDVQHNTGYLTDVILDKLVERREVKEGRTVRGRRENTSGDLVYLVDATKDEVRNLVAAERSKLIRDQGKRLLPRDILDECREQIDATLADDNAKDPDATKKKILDKFASVGVGAAALKEYLGKPLESLTKKDLDDLRATYNGLAEGSFTWADVMRVQTEAAEGAQPASPTSAKQRVMNPPPLGDSEPAKPPEPAKS